MSRLVPLVGCLLLTLVAGLQAQQRNRSYPPQLDGARVEVYKTVGDVKLNAYIYEPEGHKQSDARPAIVFFFGGGWANGSPAQFEQQCKYLAGRGMVAITADYRVASRHGVKAVSCVADGKSAIRWVRANAQRLGIDPERIVAAGGSAGGHVAASTGVIRGRDESGEDEKISSVPNAMVLFNPAVVLANVEGKFELDKERGSRLGDRMGVEPTELSPVHHIRKGLPPTLILHGKADSGVPYKTVEIYTELAKEAGNRCELAGYEGQGHGFFNYGNQKNFVQTLRRTDEFLTSLGYLEGKPTIEE